MTPYLNTIRAACIHCKIEKPFSDFAVRTNRKVGVYGHCRECDAKKSKLGYEKHKEKRREAIRGKRKVVKLKSPEKVAARDKVSNAVRDGRLFKKPCEVCSKKKVEAHHPDYSKPLDVKWLCTKHHKELHRKAQSLPAHLQERREWLGGVSASKKVENCNMAQTPAQSAVGFS
jgi:hypothetical protein